MSSTSDSMGGAAQRGQKRNDPSASQQLCKNQDCKGFGKALGNGYCQDCCISRGVPFKAPKRPLVSSASASHTLSDDHIALSDKVLVCRDDLCVIGHVEKIWRETTTDVRLYSVKIAGDGAIVRIKACDARKYTDSADYPIWPSTAHPIRTLVHGLSRSIGVSPGTSNTLKRITPFGNIAGVSVDSDGNPDHYFVLCVNEAKGMEGRVVHASDIVLFNQSNVPSVMNESTKLPAPTPSIHYTPPVEDYFVAKARVSVMSVLFEDLKAWILGKGFPVDEQLKDKNDLVQLMVHNKLDYDVIFHVSEDESDVLNDKRVENYRT
jgi:hypothetical protein